MTYQGQVRRWDLFWADLDYPVGSEQGGGHRPITKLEGKERKVYPFEVILPKEVVATGWTSVAMPQQICTIDRSRLLERIGSLGDPEIRRQVEGRLLAHLGIDFEIWDI